LSGFPAQDRQGGAVGGDGYGKQPDGYANVPAHKEYEFGWNRGNPHHYISRNEQSKDRRFRTRVSCSTASTCSRPSGTRPLSLQVRWGDQKGGYGEDNYEYNHGPGKEYAKEPAYAPPELAYAPPPPPKYPA
jgi:hypothetical protein